MNNARQFSIAWVQVLCVRRGMLPDLDFNHFLDQSNHVLSAHKIVDDYWPKGSIKDAARKVEMLPMLSARFRLSY